MKIYLYLPNKVSCYFLSKDISGSYSFDDNRDEDDKLINIEARDGRWVLYATKEVLIVSSNKFLTDVAIEPNTFYVLQRRGQKYLIFVAPLDIPFLVYQHSNETSFVVGNGESSTLNYNCPFLQGDAFQLSKTENGFVIEKRSDVPVYINSSVLTTSSSTLNYGDEIHLYGMRLLLLDKLIFISNVGNKVLINAAATHLVQASLPPGDAYQDLEVTDVNLYSKESYFAKAPRFARSIMLKEINIASPPNTEKPSEQPFLLTVGPMITMGMSSFVMVYNTVNNIMVGNATIASSWPNLLSSGAMLLSMFLWPLLSRKYSKHIAKKQRERAMKLYMTYLNNKQKQIIEEAQLQESILRENLISYEECLNVIKNRTIFFWNKRTDQNDFLEARIGIGSVPLQIKVNFPEEEFSLVSNSLREEAEKIVGKYRYIENVPMSYNFYVHFLTAVLGEEKERYGFVQNILIQFLTFYSYDDLKVVVFTDSSKERYWDYLRYMNHNFSNNRDFRFFASNVEDAKTVMNYLNGVLNQRKQIQLPQSQKTYKPHYLILIDNYDDLKRYDFFKNLTESLGVTGFSVIFVTDRISKLPSKCDNFITLNNKTSGILLNAYETQHQIYFSDEIATGVNMMNLARVLSNVPIEFEDAAKSLPNAIAFLEMEKVGKVEQLNILNRWNSNDSTRSLKAEVGVDVQGDLLYLDLHEKAHGPHGLIAGMTGSGKSEFIITYILSMAMNYSPDDVAFILIDYKGGGLAFAFENKAIGKVLPHLAGTITNLDKAEMDRTLVSIDSELKRRQTIFNEARDQMGESTIDIYKYQRLYKEGKLSEPIPHLFIICDEFAELKSQQPEFMDSLISAARIGRSLGVHLILATQKPSGVVNDQIWSNTKFRVCLKVQDASDSKEMLKKPDAASLKQTGRFYLQVGYDELFLLGQSAWCGAKYYPSDKILREVDKSINFLSDSGQFIKSVQGSSGQKKGEAQGEQLANILDLIIDVAKQTNKKAMRLWLENIPEIILESNLRIKYQIQEKPYDVKAVIGEYDAPELQTQGLVSYSFLEDGNTIIYGNDGAERENLLMDIVFSSIQYHTPEEINYYMIDFGSESLRNFENLPHVGGIVYQGEKEKFTNLYKLLTNELRKRKKLFASFGGEYKNYIKSSGKTLPIITVIFNNYDTINETYPELYDDMPNLARDSARYGIVYILTGNATNSIPSKVSQNFTNMFAFKLKDISDYTIVFGKKASNMPKDIFGRGLILNGEVHEFQTASIVEDRNTLQEYILQVSSQLKNHYKVKAKPIPTLPDKVTFDFISSEITDISAVPVGVSSKELEIVKMDYKSNLSGIITSNKLSNMYYFVRSFLYELRSIKENNMIIIDAVNELRLDKQLYLNYYTDNLDKVFESVLNFILKLKESGSQQKGTLFIYGVSKFISRLTAGQTMEQLVDAIKSYEGISLILVDDAKKLKEYGFETWYKIVSSYDGIFVGRGVTDQSVIRLSDVSRELSAPIKNDMGYVIIEGEPILTKLIDFEEHKGDDIDE